ncbi:MAG: hypothetical protein WBA74_28095 [Cyclobacteriaceae bacterium]
MKPSRIVLLVAGILGIIASIFMMFSSDDQTFSLLGLVCGSSLIYGSFDMKKERKGSVEH